MPHYMGGVFWGFLFVMLWLLTINGHLLAQLPALLNDKSGAVGSPIPEGDHLIRIADDFQIPPQKYILLEITFPLLPPPLLPL